MSILKLTFYGNMIGVELDIFRELALGLEKGCFKWCFHHEIVAATEARNHPQECILRKRTTFFHNPNWIVPKVFSSDAL